MNLHSGTPLGRYQIIGPLGAGGMGEVYRAQDARLDREVAIKMLPAELARDPEALARFEREAKLLAALNHPHIATIHGLEQSDRDESYLILELVEGQPLTERLLDGPLPVGEALRVGAQVSEALEAAHERGVIHRDLKPANVMVSPRGWVKVLDFGLATRTDDRAGAMPGGVWVDEDGGVMGTPGYMSPEQVLAQPQDHRTDLFSFGCVLYECMTGRRAFPGDNIYVVTAAVLSEDPDWSALPPDTPPRARDLLERCLAKDVEARPDSMTTVRAWLDEAMGVGAAIIGPREAHLPAAPGRRALHNLPPQVTSFIGRDAEIAECTRLLENTRLLTLTGVGGCGKTRLALRVAETLLDETWDGVWFVDLAPLTDAERVPDVVASALSLRDEPGRTAAEGIAAFLAGKHVVLAVDNCEHVLAACAHLVDALLRGCPRLRILASSREALGIGGEQAYRVPSLSVPDASPAFGRTT